MKTLSLKLQARFVCNCGEKITKIYKEDQINTRHENNNTVNFVYIKCPKCNIIEEVEIYIEKNLANSE